MVAIDWISIKIIIVSIIIYVAKICNCLQSNLQCHFVTVPTESVIGDFCGLMGYCSITDIYSVLYYSLLDNRNVEKLLYGIQVVLFSIRGV